MEKEYQKFHELKRVYMVVVAEGNGTYDSPVREVKYIFDENLNSLGKIDNLNNKS
jgi:hypothetical protein